MTKENIIDFYMDQLSTQNGIYAPGKFWSKAIKTIADEYSVCGIKNFRNSKINLQFFVPTYGSPGNGFSLAEIDSIKAKLVNKLSTKQLSHLVNSLDGTSQASSDFGTFHASNEDKDQLNLLEFSESSIGAPKEHFDFGGKKFSRSSLNYLLGLSFLKKVLPNFIPKTVLEIGGGFGTLGEILFKSNVRDFKYIDLDLPPMFLIAEDFIKSTFINEKVSIRSETSEKEIKIRDLEKFTFLPNWKIENLKGSIDLFVNFISFQEMEPFIVRNYASYIQKLMPKYILLRNLREGKQKSKNGELGVEQPILQQDYISFFDQYKMLETNVLPFGYKTADGFHSQLTILSQK